MLAVYRWDLPRSPTMFDYFVVDLREDGDYLLVRLSEAVGSRWEPRGHSRGYWDALHEDGYVSRVS